MGNTRQPREPKPRRGRPASSPQARENQLIALSVDLAEKQIKAGTASAQVISHFLKLGSSREKLEQERINNENVVLQARAEQLASAKRVEELYAEALDAMRAYAGQDPLEMSDDYEN